MMFASHDALRRTRHRDAPRGLVVLAFAALCLAALARFSFVGERFSNDPGLYIAMGKTVVDGRQLYVDLWDTKLPGITLLTAPLYSIFRDRWWAYVTLQFAMIIVGAAMLAGAAGRVAIAVGADAFILRRVRLATAIVGLVLLNIQWLLITGFQLETPMLVCASLGAWATLRAIAEPRPIRAIAWALLAGIGGGMAATLKPTAFAVSGAGILALLELLRRGELSRAVRISSGLFVGIVVMLAVNVAWYSHLKVWPFLGDLTREISLYGIGTPWAQILRPKTAVILALLLMPVTVALVAFGLRPAGEAPGNHPSPRGAAVLSAAFVLASSWLAMELAGSILQKRGYAYHFLPIAAPATLLLGLIVVAGGTRLRSLSLVIALGVAPAAGCSLAMSAYQWSDIFAGRASYPAKLVDYVRNHTKPGDAIFADPLGELVVMTDRRPGSRVGMMIYFVNHDGAPEKFSKLLIDDLEERQCEMVILPIPKVLQGRIAGWEEQQVLGEQPERRAAYRAAWKRFITYVHQHYTRESRNVEGREIWRRLPSGATTRPAATQSATTQP